MLHCGINPRLACSPVHRVEMRPTTADVRDPWTLSIRLSAVALASDAHTLTHSHTSASAREWKHTTGKRINVTGTL